MKRDQDAFGRAVYDRYRGLPAHEIIERSDGYIDVSPGPDSYLSPYRSWSAHEKSALRLARGRVLDVGCNAGRHALYLQERGHDVVGIDVSPLAIETARRRGLRQAHVLTIGAVSPRRLGLFDTVLMLGNNLGLLGNAHLARRLLRRFWRMTNPEARIIGESLDVYMTRDPFHLRYQASNRRKGRMSGQIRIRGRYKTLRSPWFDYLLLSRRELEQLIRGNGWQVEKYFAGPGPRYIAALARSHSLAGSR